MTDKVENQVEAKEEQSPEAKVLEKINSIVEEKTAPMADMISKSDAEEMINKATEEAKAASSEEITKLNEKLQDLEAEVSKPAAIAKSGESNMIKFEKMDTELGTVTAQKFDIITKRQGANNDVPGGLVDSNTPFYTLEQENPFRTLASIIPASGGLVKLPSIAGITWASESAQPASPRTAGGSSASKNVTIETWVSENEYSLANLEDVPGMDGAIAGLMSARLGRAEAADAVAVIDGATFPTGQAITTGSANALPTAGNVVGRMTMLLESLASPYSSRGTFVVSRDLYARIQESDNNGLNFDPRTGISTLFGRPLVIADTLEATAAGALVGVFGDFSSGLALCTAADMTIGRFDQTRPGSMTYFGRARFKNAIWDPAAIATFKVGA